MALHFSEFTVHFFSFRYWFQLLVTIVLVLVMIMFLDPELLVFISLLFSIGVLL